jgi:cytochrome b
MPDTRPTRMITVWDLPTRLFHWSLVGTFVVMWTSGRMGKLDIHLKLGAVVLMLLLFRLAWGVVGSETARFAGFLTGPDGIRAYLRGQWAGLGHNPLGALSVVVMLALLLLQAGTGLFATDDIATDGPLAWAVSSKATKALSALHRLNSWLLLGLVGLHLAAIAFYRVARGETLTPPMITGQKRAPADLKAPEMASPALAAALLAACGTLVFGALAIWGR